MLLSLNAFADSGVLDAIRAEVDTDKTSITNLHPRRDRGMYLALSNALQTLDFRTNQTDESVLMRVSEFLPMATFGKYDPLFTDAEVQITATLSVALAISAETVNALDDSKEKRRAEKRLAKVNKAMARVDESVDPWQRARRIYAARRSYDKLAEILSEIL